MSIRKIIEALWSNPRMKVCFTGEMARVQMEPGDVLVLSSAEPIPDDTCMRLRHAMEQEFPGHKCIVLADGLKLGVVGVPRLTEEVYPPWLGIQPHEPRRN